MAETKKSQITFTVELDQSNVPEKITWTASDINNYPTESKSIMLSIWDHTQQNTLKIDLWTKDMRLEEMDLHFFQTLLSLAESYQKATKIDFIVKDMREFCQKMTAKINETEKLKNKA